MSSSSNEHGVPDVPLVQRLLREQASPHLSTAAISPSPAAGSSNWVFRVGDRHAVRLPRTDDYVDDLLKEAHWLPQLAPELSTPVPEIVFRGAPSEAFPRPWLVVSWVPGKPPGDLRPAQQLRLARSLGEFVRSLHRVDTCGQAAGAERWGYRAGQPVTDAIDEWVESAASELRDLFDPTQVRRAWALIRDVPALAAPPSWVHTDLSVENILVGPDGKLAGVIDFGSMGVGDPAVDLLYAWSMFEGPALQAFRAECGADQATWSRARAWAFAGPGLLTIADYRHSMPARTVRLIRMVEAVAADEGVDLHRIPSEP